MKSNYGTIVLVLCCGSELNRNYTSIYSNTKVAILLEIHEAYFLVGQHLRSLKPEVVFRAFTASDTVLWLPLTVLVYH